MSDKFQFTEQNRFTPDGHKNLSGAILFNSDYLSRTLFSAHTATGAFAVIHHSNVVFDLHSARRAELFAYLTSDTSRVTVSAYCLTAVR